MIDSSETSVDGTRRSMMSNNEISLSANEKN